MAFICVENLRYRYHLVEKDQFALNGLTFSIQQGEFIGIIGENNAGKSTLCQAFSGIVPHFYKGAYGGKILLNDLEVAKIALSELCRKIGLVFQNPFSQITGARDTVFEEIAFGLENLCMERNEMIHRVEEAMDLLQITDYKSRNPFELSGGQMQRVAIASIFAMNPEIIVLDEPTSQLDPQGSIHVFDALQKLSKKGITIILAEHKMEELAAYCDKILLLYQGQLIDFDTPEKIFSRNDLLDYGIKPPIYTSICKTLKKHNANSILYPITLEQATKALILED